MKTSGNRQQAFDVSNPASGTRVAPSGASTPRRLAASTLTKRRGHVVVDQERCKACELCLEVCPEGSLELSPILNSFAYHPVRLKEDDSCTGCALCAQVCPDVALEVYRE